MRHLHETVTTLSDVAVSAIELMSLAIIVIGTVEAFLKTFGALFERSGNADLFRPIWLRYSRWLVGGLTFQLAADIVATSTTPTWEEIGKLGAIAVIRTFLNYFLARDERDVARDMRPD